MQNNISAAIEFDHQQVKELLIKQQLDSQQTNSINIGKTTIKVTDPVKYINKHIGMSSFVTILSTILALVAYKFIAQRRKELEDFDLMYLNFKDEIHNKQQRELDK